MSKVLVIQGDPRVNGTSKQLSEAYIAIMEAHQHQVVKVDVRTLDYDAMLRDAYQTLRSEEMLAIEAFAKEADLLVFFYPIWFANVPAALKGFIENLFWVRETYSFKTKEYLWSGKWRGKKASIFYTIGGREMYHYFFGHGGYRGVRQPLWLSGVFDIKKRVFQEMDRSRRKPFAYYQEKVVQDAYRDVKRLARMQSANKENGSINQRISG